MHIHSTFFEYICIKKVLVFPTLVFPTEILTYRKLKLTSSIDKLIRRVINYALIYIFMEDISQCKHNFYFLSKR